MEDQGPSTSKDPQQVNQDELIKEQKRKIEREISESIPLVGDKQPIKSLIQAYKGDEVYMGKIKDLSSKYSSLRKIRPDGNCFFRSFGYAVIDSLITRRNEFDAFYAQAEASKDFLVSQGFTPVTVEDFHKTYMEVLKRVRDVEDVNEARKTLHELFNQQEYSDYMVVYLRLLTSAQLQKDKEFYTCFIDCYRTVSDFCHHEVEPLCRESDHIHIIAACAVLNVGVRVVYLDRGNSKKVVEHDVPEGSKPAVFLLYRPGHYEILHL